jgi:hypothetical protein
MNKRIIKEKEGTLIIVDILFYISIVLVGYFLVDFENYNVRDTLALLPSIFYVIAFLSCIAYFVNRKRDYYEFLMFSLINVAVGTYILINRFNPEGAFVIGDALLIYVIGIVINKLYLAKVLWDKKNINFIPKLVNSVLILCIGAFASFSLYSKEDVAYMIIGYFIMGYGLISLLEPFTYILLNNPTIDKLLISFLKYNKGEEKKLPKLNVKSLKRSKINYKEKVGTLVKKEENINKNKKKKKL